MANFCSSCGEKLSPGAKFCPKCGQKVQLVTAYTNDQGGITIEAPEGSTVTIEDNPFTAAAKPAQRSDKTAPGVNAGNRSSKAAAAPKVPEKTSKAAAAPKVREKTRETVPAPKTRENNNATVGKRKGSGFAFLLAVILVIEFFYAGFRQPGFLRKSPKEPHYGTGITQTSGGGTSSGGTGSVQGLMAGSGTGSGDGGAAGEDTITITVGDNEYVFPADSGPAPEVTEDNCPGNPKFIPIRYSREEIASAPKKTAQVSEDSPSAQFDNGVSADLFWWNLESGPDELVVRTLPEKTDETASERMIGYDFSLSSGRHEFPTNITVTIPRTASEENEGGIMYFNEETGEWERVYYEVSDDGGSYVVYMDHFSTIAELLFGEGRKKMETALAGNIFVESGWRPTARGWDEYSYMAGQDQDERQWHRNDSLPPAQRTVELANLNMLCQFIAAQDGQSQAIVEAMTRRKDTSGTLMNTVEQVNTWFGNIGGVVSTADVTGKVSEGVAAAAFQPDKSVVDAFFRSAALETGGKLERIGSYFDKGSKIILTAKVLLQCFDKNMTWGDIYRDNYWDITGVILGMAGEYLKREAFNKAFLGASGAMAIAAVALFIGVLTYDSLEKGVWVHAVNSHDSFEERVYHEYLMQGNPRVVNGFTLYPSAKGFADALNYIYENEFKDSRNFNGFANRVETMIDIFVDEFWTLPDEEIEKFANRNAWVAEKWERPPATYVKEYKYRIRMGLYDELVPIMENLAKKEYIKLVEDYAAYMETYIIPVLNTEIFMVPKDLDLPAGEDPLHSAYLGWNGESYLVQEGKKYLPAAEFTDAAEALIFVPRGAEESRIGEYTKIEPLFEDGYSYKTIGGNNYLYKCTFYHYVQIGSPTKMKISGIEPFDLGSTMGTVNWKNAEYRDDGSVMVPVEYASEKKESASYKAVTCDVGFIPDDQLEDLLWGAGFDAKLTLSGTGISGSSEAQFQSHRETDPVDKPGEKRIEESDTAAALSFHISGEAQPGTSAGVCTISGTAHYRAKGRFYWQLGSMNMNDDTSETSYDYTLSGTGTFTSSAGGDFISVSFDELKVTRSGQSVLNGTSSSGNAEWSGMFTIRFVKEN